MDREAEQPSAEELEGRISGAGIKRTKRLLTENEGKIKIN